MWMEVWKSQVGVPSSSKGGSVSLVPVRGWEWRGWSETRFILEWPAGSVGSGVGPSPPTPELGLASNSTSPGL